MSYDETDGLIPMDIIDEPLLIVLDDDDYDDNENFHSITTTDSNILFENLIETKNILPTDESDKIEVKNLIESYSTESNNKPDVSHRSPKPSQQAKKSSKAVQTTPINKQRRTKKTFKPKNLLTLTNSSIDSALSYISFDRVSNILTVSRMGSIYYCLEDIYSKLFSSLCTLEEFTDLLVKPQLILIKQVTLSEKLAIIEENPQLKTYSHIRYRLIPIDSSDYLTKLKQLLLNNKKSKNIEKMIRELSNYKQTSTSISSNDKITTKQMSVDDVEQEKQHFHEEPDLFTQINSPVYLKNETIETELLIEIDNNDLSDSSPIQAETTSPSPIKHLTATSPSLSPPLKKVSLCGLHRSNSLIYNKRDTEKTSFTRSPSLPSIKFNIEENIMYKFETNITKPMNSFDEYYSMPMIVNVEENVQMKHEKYPISQQLTNSTYCSYVHPSSTLSLTPQQPSYNLYQQQFYSSNQHNIQSTINPPPPDQLSPIITSLLEKPIYQNTLPSEQQQQPMSPNSCCLPCCRTKQTSLSQTVHPNTRMMYRQNPSVLKSISPINQKQHQIRLSPYPPIKTYFAPLVNCYPCSQNSLCTDPIHHQSNSSTIISLPNTPHDLRLPYVCTHSIDLSQAIIEHNNCHIDKLPKLVVRHTKTYSNKTIETMGQLFPTWFNEPDYRCIHCFKCDKVFTPQLFMTHVDDQILRDERPLNMTSIELLTSEKMSENKVELWNQFCKDLTIYASKCAETENSSQDGSNSWIQPKQEFLNNHEEVVTDN